MEHELDIVAHCTIMGHEYSSHKNKSSNMEHELDIVAQCTIRSHEYSSHKKSWNSNMVYELDIIAYCTMSTLLIKNQNLNIAS